MVRKNDSCEEIGAGFVRISQNSAMEIDKTFAKIEMFLILCT